MTSPLDTRRPQPITKASAIVGVVATVVAAAVFLGVLPAADGDAVTGALNVAVPSVVAVVATVHTLLVHFTAKATTTPVSDPKAVVVQPDGTKALDALVPLSLTVNPYNPGAARSAGAHAADTVEDDTDPTDHPDFDSSV